MIYGGKTHPLSTINTFSFNFKIKTTVSDALLKTNANNNVSVALFSFLLVSLCLRGYQLTLLVHTLLLLPLLLLLVPPCLVDDNSSVSVKAGAKTPRIGHSCGGRSSFTERGTLLVELLGLGTAGDSLSTSEIPERTEAPMGAEDLTSWPRESETRSSNVMKDFRILLRGDCFGSRPKCCVLKMVLFIFLIRPLRDWIPFTLLAQKKSAWKWDQTKTLLIERHVSSAMVIDGSVPLMLWGEEDKAGSAPHICSALSSRSRIASSGSRTRCCD